MKNKTRKENRVAARIANIPLAKRFLILLLIIIITIGVISCMGILRTDESIMLEHLSEKYNGQEFISIGISGSHNFGGDPILYCYPKGGDPEADKVKVTMSKVKNGKRSFSDSYFNIIIREDFEADVLAVLSDMPLPMKVYYSGTSYLDEIFDGTKTYADFKQWEIDRGEPYLFDVEVVLLCEDVENGEQYANQIFDKLEKDNYHGSVVVFIVSDAGIYEKITRNNWSEIWSEIYREANDRKETIPRYGKNLNLRKD